MTGDLLALGIGVVAGISAAVITLAGYLVITGWSHRRERHRHRARRGELDEADDGD